MKKKLNIAFDGYSSCGKSTLAKAVAKELNYIYLDTGAMYRAISLYAIKGGFVDHGNVDEEGLIASLDNVYISFKYNPDHQMSGVYLNTKNVEKEIRTMQVSNYVSQVSNIKQVRQKMVKLQKRFAENRGVVMDGRDIGTVVMPDADLKFFMVADESVRIQRRYDELISKGVEITKDIVAQNIQKRDFIDTTRSNDPLVKADDAIVLDNSHLTEEEQFQFVLAHVHKMETAEQLNGINS